MINANTNDLTGYTAALQAYKRARQISDRALMAKEGKEWLWQLRHTLKNIRPNPESILSSAKSRGYRVKRRTTAFPLASGGLSLAARRGAESKLEGEKSDYFKVVRYPGGISLRRVRFSARKSRKLLRGNRYGNRFAPSALKSRQAGEEAVNRARQQDPTVKRLNARALGVAIELGLRARAGKGGTIRAQFIHKVSKNRNSSTLKSGEMVARSSKGLPMGTVRAQLEGEKPRVQISALVPGTAKVFRRFGIIKSIATLIAIDRMKYVRGEHKKDEKHLRKRK